MKTKITRKLIQSFDACYDPKKVGFTNALELTPLQFIDQFTDKVKNKEDIIWLLCRKEFMSDRKLRLFAVWCVREALKLIETPDIRSINACAVAEQFANGKATPSELNAAWAAARAAARDASDAAWDAAWDARAAAWDARDAAMLNQIEQLKTYFNE